jgi:choline kinase
LSGGIRILAAAGLMRAFDIGNASWCDIDTVEDLRSAESLFATSADEAVVPALAR